MSRRLAQPAICAGVVAALMLLRVLVVTDPFDGVWAEDGAVFLRDAEVDGLSAIGHRYAGYLHLVPRLVAAVGAHLPLSAYAAFAAAASAAIAGLLAAFVFTVATRVLGSRSAAAVAALAIALAPPLRGESLANLANLHWYLLYAAFWAMLDTRRTAAAVALLATLSSPLTVLVTPAAFAVHGRTAWRRPAVIAVASGALVQGLAGALAASSGGGPDRDAGFNEAIVKALARDVLGAAHGPSVARYLVALIVAGVLAWAWRSADAAGRRLALVVWGTGLLVYLAASVTTGQPQMRYVAIASIFAIAGFAAVLPRLGRGVAVAGCCVLAALTAEGFPASSFRASGPSWSEGVRAHDAACARGTAQPIPLNPDRFGGVARLPCDEISWWLPR